MLPLERVQTISRQFRRLLICFSALIAGAVIVGLLGDDATWLSIGDEAFTRQLREGTIDKTLTITLLAPIGGLFILGVYWLQRLFGAYAASNFFTNESMRCYLWLVWLKVASFIYTLVLPILMSWSVQTDSAGDVELMVEAGTLAELMILLLIVHILREAQRINEDNKGFV